VQVSTLLYCIGSEGERVFTSFKLSEDDGKKFDTVVERFNAYFVPKVNVIHERAQFHSRSQKHEENIEAYVRALYELSENTQFEKREEAIRDRLVLGVKDRELSEKLQLTAGLELDKAVETARQWEQVKAQLAEQRVGESASVNAVQNRHNHGHKHGQGHWNKNNGKGHKGQPHGGGKGQNSQCTKCGRQHSKTDTCPANGKTCHKCRKMNHFEKMCKSKGLFVVSHSHEGIPEEVVHETVVNKGAPEGVVRKVGIPEGVVHRGAPEKVIQNCSCNEKQDKNMMFLGSLGVEEKEPPWRETFTILNKAVSFKVDTGADVSVISESVFRSLKPRPKLTKSNAVLHTPGGRVESLGQFIVHVHREEKKISFRLFVLKGKTDNLLSRDAAVRLGLVKRIDANEVSNMAFGEIGAPVKTDPVKIELEPGIEPYSISVPRRIPLPLLPKVEAELKRMEENDVIEKITSPTDWCSPMVPVLKKNGDVRICVDLKRLNRAVKRERYTMPVLEDMTHKLAGSKMYSKLDASSGFWQVPLDPETAKYTTFMTPFGRYFFKRLPFGINLAPEVFQRIMENIIGTCDGVVCFMDDVLVYGDSEDTHDRHLSDVMQRVADAGLKLNKEKCEFRKQSLNFLGHTLSAEGIQPDQSKLSAITEMKEPENVPELRRFLGMVNYLGRFVANLAEELHPLNELLKKESHWTWGPAQSRAFERVKRLLTTAPTLAFYDASKPTVVSSDASSYGIGGVIMQEHDGQLHPIAFCSRTLSGAEQKYAQIEKECLGIIYTCEKFERFLVGLPNFRFLTDHRPLVPLINRKDLHETPLRCQRMLMRLMRYNLTAEYVPGKQLVVADTLSRSPVKREEEDTCPANLEQDVFAHVNSVRVSWNVTDVKLDKLRQATQTDIQLATVLDYIRLGWPEYKEDCKLAAREYYGIKDELSEYEGLVTRGGRIVIPWSYREEMLERIHDGHQGIQKCRERANQSIWWPGMGQSIKDMVGKCKHCREKRPTQMKEPLIASALPDYPFQKIGVDLCETKGKTFMVVVDYYSRYIEIARLGKTTSDVVVEQLKMIFARVGIPEIVISDNGPQFSSSEFKSFSQKWNFVHVTSSPHFPQSNGEAERAVQTAKTLIQQDDLQLALLTYRATPIPSLGFSPAELALGRKIRSTLPCLPETLIPQTPKGEVFKDNNQLAKQQQKHYFDRNARAHPLPELHPGDKVLIKLENEKKWTKPAEVAEKYSERSYVVKTQDGATLRRNRRHLQQYESPESPAAAEKVPATEQNPRRSSIVSETGPEPEPVQPPGQPTPLPTPEATTTRSGRLIKRPSRYDD